MTLTLRHHNVFIPTAVTTDVTSDATPEVTSVAHTTHMTEGSTSQDDTTMTLEVTTIEVATTGDSM